VIIMLTQQRKFSKSHVSIGLTQKIFQVSCEYWVNTQKQMSKSFKVSCECWVNITKKIFQVSCEYWVNTQKQMRKSFKSLM